VLSGPSGRKRPRFTIFQDPPIENDQPIEPPNDDPLPAKPPLGPENPEDDDPFVTPFDQPPPVQPPNPTVLVLPEPAVPDVRQPIRDIPKAYIIATT
jgi:hypothetical protein